MIEVIAYQKIVKVLSALPTYESRRRVLRAAQVLAAPNTKPLPTRTTRAGKQDKPKK